MCIAARLVPCMQDGHATLSMALGVYIFQCIPAMQAELTGVADVDYCRKQQLPPKQGSASCKMD